MGEQLLNERQLSHLDKNIRWACEQMTHAFFSGHATKWSCVVFSSEDPEKVQEAVRIFREHPEFIKLTELSSSTDFRTTVSPSELPSTPDDLDIILECKGRKKEL